MPFVLLLFALLFSACADEETTDETAVQEPLETPETMGAGVSLAVAEQNPFGQYLTDAEGRALYLFTADTQGQSSACYDACAEAWPPLLTEGASAAAAPNLDSAMMGTLTRTDGTMQVTYNGWPLYYFQRDTGAGTVQGQHVNAFGGEWYLVSPQGQQIEAGE